MGQLELQGFYKIPDKLTRSQYTDYLCQSSLIKERLFAVKMCDIPPSGMSSVCFFYDLDMKAVCRDLEWVKEMAGRMHYYYMGVISIPALNHALLPFGIALSGHLQLGTTGRLSPHYGRTPLSLSLPMLPCPSY